MDESKKTVFEIQDDTYSEDDENSITITNVVKSDVPHGKTVKHQSENVRKIHHNLLVNEVGKKIPHRCDSILLPSLMSSSSKNQLLPI